MKTTRILIPMLTLAAAASLVAQALPGATPVPKGQTPAPQTPPAPTEAFPAPGDPVPKPPATQPPAPAPKTPLAPAETPKVPLAPTVQPKPPTPAGQPLGPIQFPKVPAPQPPLVGPIAPKPPAPVPPAVNPLNAPRAEPFIGIGKINGTRVSARGRATIFSSLVFQFNKNEPVNIIEAIDIKNPKAGEPRKWYRVQMPQDTGVWVHGNFLGQPFTKNVLNAAGQPVPLTYAEVTANLLNVRGNAGDNFPIVGKLRKGTLVRLSTQKKGKWIELFAPPNASVFVAAQFVTPIPLNGGVVEVPGAPVQPFPQPVQPVQPKQPLPNERVVPVPTNQFGQPAGLAPDGTPIKRAGTPGTVKPGAAVEPVTPKPNTPSVAEVKPVEPKPPVKPVEPVETVKPVEPKPTIQQAKTNENGKPTAGAETGDPAAKTADPTEAAAKPEAKPEDPIRIVTREGVVRRKYGLHSPTTYALVHTESGKTINYLMLDRPDIKLKWFTGQKILVSGQEAIDPRAATTPVLKVKTLKGDVSPKVIEEFIVARAKARQKAREEAVAKIKEAAQPKEPEAVKPEEQPKPEVKPETEKPAEPKPAEPKPEGEKPAEPKPAEPKPEGEKPAEPKPAEPKPEGEKPAEPKPAEPKPEDEKPAEPKPAEPKPEGEKPAEPKPAEPKPEGEKPSEPKLEEKKPEAPKPAPENQVDNK